MRKAKIYKPTKSAMQSGKRNSKNWILEHDTENNSYNPLMGWESSKDMMNEVKLEFETKWANDRYPTRSIKTTKMLWPN